MVWSKNENENENEKTKHVVHQLLLFLTEETQSIF